MEELYGLSGEQIVASGNYSDKSTKITFRLTSADDIFAEINKSDTARLLIPELDVEIPPGRQRYCTIQDFLKETQENIEEATTNFTHNSMISKVDLIIHKIEMALIGQQDLTIVLDDPLSISSIEEVTNEQLKTIEIYHRTFDQCEELGIPYTSGFEVKYFNDIKKAAPIVSRYIQQSKKIVVFSGAGVSVESGIPAFRTPGADDNIWDNHSSKDEVIDNFMATQKSREGYWKMCSDIYPKIRDASPNPSHTFFYDMYEEGKLYHIITQNIDGLYEKAGIPPYKIIELHGSCTRVVCLSCDKYYDRDEIHQRNLDGDLSPWYEINVKYFNLIRKVAMTNIVKDS
eukprot:TRINITY_DN5600_c0_g1_i3.p1 TRINITY_DN5600_c0_g1~~TRINITY_DN5600_c0_g1_i3.p1  ORF type:complete len:344 (-),score=59.82 TRINITY_DN5600_c0_g1_i3:388-1419(-)